jgi:membrane protease YdiL (CAAX protease family)
MIQNFFHLRKFGWLTTTRQVVLLIFACLALIGVGLANNNESFQTIFAPFYEEIIFRGLLFGSLLSIYNKKTAIVISSLFFGLWHLKNFPTESTGALIYQVFYTGLLLGPLLAWLALRTKSIWIGVLVHALNNLLSPLSWWIIDLL